MEFSSPLAAMQPPPPPRFGCRGQDASLARALFPARSSFGGPSFSFHDFSSLRKQSTDYFSGNPVRGSSPAASLAADLSQNFHIDQRSLFTSNIFQSQQINGAITPPIRWEGARTPPIPSSSPGYGHDSMDMSPLPHKPAFSFASRNVPSPTPDDGKADEDMISPLTDAPPPASLQVPKPTAPLERKRPAFRRPSLSRTKGFSTTTVSLKTASVEQPAPPITFGAPIADATDAPLSLAECFAASPAQDRTMFSKPLGGPPRPRPQLASFNSSFRVNGSPCQAAPRKSVGQLARPRKQFRRSLSMFEHPDDVMKQEKSKYSPSGLQSIMDVDDTHSLQLPHFVPDGEPDSLPRIEMNTLVQILDGQFNHLYDDICVVDCRFEYEYEGGHIQGAVNHNDKESLAGKLFTPETNPNTLLVFHCEYSAHRAPIMAKFVRQRDRAINDFQYPKLTYPEMYILEGGYSAFFKSHSTRCFPQNYVEMDAKEHERACERGMSKLRQRAKLSRAHTFALGQSCILEESPTAQSRPKSRGPVDLSGPHNPFDSRRIHARRMASY